MGLVHVNIEPASMDIVPPVPPPDPAAPPPPFPAVPVEPPAPFPADPDEPPLPLPFPPVPLAPPVDPVELPPAPLPVVVTALPPAPWLVEPAAPDVVEPADPVVEPPAPPEKSSVLEFPPHPEATIHVTSKQDARRDDKESFFIVIKPPDALGTNSKYIESRQRRATARPFFLATSGERR
jgi:hypothetical protein